MGDTTAGMRSLEDNYNSRQAGIFTGWTRLQMPRYSTLSLKAAEHPLLGDREHAITKGGL